MCELKQSCASFAPAMIAPCILYISKESERIPEDAEVCCRIIQLLRDVKIDWASEVLASNLTPYVPLLMTGRHSLALLSVGMCYSRELFLGIYKNLLRMFATRFSELGRDLLRDTYTLTYRIYQVAQHVPSMAPHAYTMLVVLYDMCQAFR
jgi:hypothetical protein